ncbi:hypothetical protein [Photobacterium satsumensis]|uniref:hypothetical protein n=1 Tax=Photobacterium satsumensis TaxID=2910239 RepID=UPI003D0F55AF
MSFWLKNKTGLYEKLAKFEWVYKVVLFMKLSRVQLSINLYLTGLFSSLKRLFFQGTDYFSINMTKNSSLRFLLNKKGKYSDGMRAASEKIQLTNDKIKQLNKDRDDLLNKISSQKVINEVESNLNEKKLKRIEGDIKSKNKELARLVDENKNLEDNVNVCNDILDKYTKVKTDENEIDEYSYFVKNNENRILSNVPFSNMDIVLISISFVAVFTGFSIKNSFFRVVFYDDLMTHFPILFFYLIIVGVFIHYVLKVLFLSDVQIYFLERMYYDVFGVKSRAKIYKAIVQVFLYSVSISFFFFIPLIANSNETVGVCYKNEMDKTAYLPSHPIYKTRGLTLVNNSGENGDGYLLINNSRILNYGLESECNTNGSKDVVIDITIDSDIPPERSGKKYLNVVEEFSECEVNQDKVLFDAKFSFERAEPVIHTKYQKSIEGSDELNPEFKPWKASLVRARKTTSQVLISLNGESPEEYKLRNNDQGEIASPDHVSIIKKMSKIFHDALELSINDNSKRLKLFVVGFTDHLGSSLDNLSLADRRIEFAEKVLGIKCDKKSDDNCENLRSMIKNIYYYPIPFSEISYLRLNPNDSLTQQQVNQGLRVTRVLLCK